MSVATGRLLYLSGIVGLLLLCLLLFLLPARPWFGREGLGGLYILLFSFLLSSTLGSPVRRLAHRFRVLDVPGGRKVHREPTPLLGGVAIYLAFVGTLLANSVLSLAVGGLLLSGTAVFLAGVVDDVRPLPALSKLAVMTLAALGVVGSGTSLALFPTGTAWGQALNALLTLLWLVGIASALNFLDGMDGLAPALAALAALFLGIIAFQSGQILVTWLAAALLGSTLGFLPYNFRPGKAATIFLGDGGSTFLGFTLATLAVMGEWAEDRLVDLAAPLLVFGVYVYDMAYITVDRVLSGKVRSVREWIEYVGRDHLHHRLEQILRSREEVVLFVCALSTVLGATAVALLMASPSAALLLVLQAVVTLLILSVLERRARGRQESGGVAAGPGDGAGPPAADWQPAARAGRRARVPLLLLLLLATGCAGRAAVPVTRASVLTAPPAPAAAPPPSVAQPPPAAPAPEAPQLEPVTENRTFVTIEGVPRYKLGAGDVLDVLVTTGLAQERQTVAVKPSGRVNVALVEAQVSGLTAEQAAEELQRPLARLYKQVSVEVLVKEYNSKRVTVWGAVAARAGSVPLKGKMTLLDLLVETGGPAPDADLERVRLVRQDAPPLTLNLLRVLAEPTAQAFALDAGDVVFVPSRGVLPGMPGAFDARERIFIFGEVRNPGAFPYAPAMRLSHALAMAGGPTDIAVLESARVIRGGVGNPQIVEADFRKLIQEGDLREDLPLLPTDLVVLPRSGIGDWNAFLAKIRPTVEILTYPLALPVQIKVLTR